MKRNFFSAVSRLARFALCAVPLVVPGGFAKTYSVTQESDLIASLQKEVKAKGYHYSVGRTGVTGFSLDELCKLDVEKQKAVAPPLEPGSGALKKSLALPAVFDWNAQGKCTPIKDQGQCGSCWAFASIGSYECALNVFQGVSTDLSEQFLVYCSADGKGCNGGACAFNSMKAGTPLESCAPYKGTQTGCQCPKYYPIQASYSVPYDVASLKQAIMSHGALYSSVAATSAFMAYTGGLFDNNDPTALINHAVVLVGWNDSLQAWRLRNSWGTAWGEKGYMWIKYGCLQIGAYSSYAIPAGVAQLTAPSNFTAMTASMTQINLSWTDNTTTESGFYIERKTGTGAYAQIATAGANVISYSDKNLTTNTIYTYRVRAYTSSLTSDYSNEASALTTTMAAPTALTATTASLTQINLAWKDNTPLEMGYYIERKTGTGVYAQIASVASNVVSYSDKSVAAGAAYTYRVRGYATGLYSDYSNEAAAGTTMAAPTTLTATTASMTQINLTWKDNTPFETGYCVERKTGTGAYAQVASLAANAAAYSDKSVTVNATYTYRVRAAAVGVYSPYSNEAAAATPTFAAPTGLTAALASLTQINLAWKDNASAETGFSIERKTGTGAYAQVAAAAANVTTYADKNLTAHAAYTYRVRAVAAQLYSAYSNEAAVAAAALSAPSAAAATLVSSVQINLSWKDNSSSESGFCIEYKTGTAAYAQIATAGPNAASAQFKFSAPLPASTKYTFRVRAAMSQVYSEYSNETSVTTAALRSSETSVITAMPSFSLAVGQAAPRILSIINARGCCVLRKEITQKFSAGDMTAAMHLAPGFYLARIRCGKEIVQERFTVCSRR